MRTPRFRPTPDRSYSLDGLITLTIVKFGTVASKPQVPRARPGIPVFRVTCRRSGAWH